MTRKEFIKAYADNAEKYHRSKFSYLGKQMEAAEKWDAMPLKVRRRIRDAAHLYNLMYSFEGWVDAITGKGIYAGLVEEAESRIRNHTPRSASESTE